MGNKEGDKLLTTMWKTLFEKLPSSLLKPWLIKREGRAKAEAEAEAMIIIARAEKTVEQIKQGTYKNINQEYLLENKKELEKIEPIFDAKELISLAAQINLQDTLRGEINTAKAILIAEDILTNDDSEPTNDSITEDWLYRWRECAGNVSTDELQSLWGALLAGEIKSPGTFSLRTLEFIKNLTMAEAKLIEKLKPFVIENFIYSNVSEIEQKINFSAFGVEFNEFLELQNLGILSGVEGDLYIVIPTSNPDYESVNLKAGSKRLVIKHDETKSNLILDCFPVSTLGQQVFELCRIDSNAEYLAQVVEEINKQEYEVNLTNSEA